MCQLEISFENVEIPSVNYDDVKNVFKKLPVTKQRKVLVEFFDDDFLGDKFENCFSFGSHLGYRYGEKGLDSLVKWNNINDLHNRLIDFMRVL